ncbi:MAG TPA: peptidyl-prolyl cis-trans isomerase [Pyrinomonadaceae bacterium]|nr:peptidyl-prolyl cis-trans isomerase [Pyrinomonadaceae bacterium]
MRSKLISLAIVGVFVMALAALAPSAARAQEAEQQVIDEVIAQVNDDVITLSMLRREKKELLESMKQSGKPEAEALAEVDKRQSELIATLVNEALLLQKGKELDLSNDVEGEVNHRMLEVAKEQGIATMDELFKRMRESGLDPEATRQTLRVEIMKQAVIQQEVDRKVFFAATMPELQKYFQEHQTDFRKPENVTISEIFLSSAGKNEADVKARALALVAQLRAGADFKKVAAANSERERDGVRTGPQDGGEVGAFEVPSLKPELANAIKDVAVGGVSEPVRSEYGFQIFRVDQRTPGSTTATFNENQVREAMASTKLPKAREDYLQNLRNEAYIKIGDAYGSDVYPLLKIAPVKTAQNSDSTPKPEKKKGKILGIIPKP